MSDNTHSSDSFLTGLILGALLGAGALYFLSSTEEGKKVKKQLAEGSGDVLDNLADLVNDIEEKGQEFEKKAEQVKGLLEEKVGETTTTVVEEVKDDLTQIKKLQERGRRAIKYFLKDGKPLS
jgi:gas vesicle protein